MKTLDTVIDMMKAEGLNPLVLVKTTPEQLAGDDLNVNDCQLILKAGASIFGPGGKFADLANETPVGEEWDDIRKLLVAEIEDMQKADQQPTEAPRLSRFATTEVKANGSSSKPTSEPAKAPKPKATERSAQPTGPVVADVERFCRLNIPRVALEMDPPVDFVHDRDLEKLVREANERFENRQPSRDEVLNFLQERIPEVLNFAATSKNLKTAIEVRGWQCAPAPKGKGAPLTTTDRKKGVVGNHDYGVMLRNILKHDYSPEEVLDDMGFEQRRESAAVQPTSSRFGGPA